MGFWNEVKQFLSNPVDYIVEAFMPDIPEPPQPQDQGVTLSRRGSNQTIPVVWTTGGSNIENLKLGLIEVEKTTTGDKNKFLHITYVIAIGELRTVNLIHEKEFLQELAHWTQSTYKTAEYSSDETQNYGDYWKFFLSNGLNRYIPSWHIDKKVYPGLCVLKARFEYPPTEVAKDNSWLRQVPNMYVNICGINTTGAYNRTVASFFKEYMTNLEYGANISSSNIDTASFDAVAEYDNNFAPYFWNSYRLNTDKSIVQNIKELCQSTQSAVIFEDGKFVLRKDPNKVAYDVMGHYKHKGLNLTTINSDLDIVTHTIPEEDLIGGLQLQGLQNNEKYYSYEITFFDKKSQTGEIDFRSQRSDIYNFLGYLPDAPSSDKVKKIAVNYSGTSRMDLYYKFFESYIINTITVTLAPNHANVRIYDILNITYPKAEISNTRYVITKVTRNPDMSVTCNCKLYMLDANVNNKWPVIDFYGRLNGLSRQKQKLILPAGIGLDNNTQVDAFLPGSEVETVQNLVVSGSAKYGYTDESGVFKPFINIQFDQTQQPGSDTIEYQVRSIDTNKFSPPYQTVYEEYGTTVRHSIFVPGNTYVVQVRVVNVYGARSEWATAEVTLDYGQFYEKISKNFAIYEGDDTESPIAQVIDSTGAITLDEDFGEMKWGMFQSPPDPTCALCSLGSDAAHDLYDAWEDNEDLKWINFHPLASVSSANVDAYYYETDTDYAVQMKPGESFTYSGVLNAKVDWYDNTSTSDPYATYSIGWKVYDSSDTLLHTYTADTTGPTNNTSSAVYKVGPITNQAYALPYFYVYGKNTDGSNFLNILNYDIKIHKQVQKSFTAVDSSTLGGSTGAREIQVESVWRNGDLASTLTSKTFKQVSNVTVTSASGETKNVIGRYNGSTTSGGVNYEIIDIVDVNTNASTDADVNITFVGLPNCIQIKDDNGIYKYFKKPEDV